MSESLFRLGERNGTDPLIMTTFQRKYNVGYKEITELSNNQIGFLFFYYWHQVSGTVSPKNPGGASALGKEFPASVPRVIQGENPPI